MEGNPAAQWSFKVEFGAQASNDPDHFRCVNRCSFLLAHFEPMSAHFGLLKVPKRPRKWAIWDQHGSK